MLLVLGYFLHKQIGGYYQQGEHRKKDDTPAGGIGKVPPLFLHAPAWQTLQVGATLARVQERYAEKNKDGGTGAALFATGKGMAEEVPFFETPVRLAEAMRTAESARNWWNQFAESLLMPPDIRRVSKMMDKAGDQQIPREQSQFWSQMIRGDIPGQRKNLPVDMNKVKRMQLDQLAEIMENAPADVRDQVRPEFSKKFVRAKDLDPDDRERYKLLLKKDDE